MRGIFIIQIAAFCILVGFGKLVGEIADATTKWIWILGTSVVASMLGYFVVAHYIETAQREMLDYLYEVAGNDSAEETSTDLRLDWLSLFEKARLWIPISGLVLVSFLALSPTPEGVEWPERAEEPERAQAPARTKGSEKVHEQEPEKAQEPEKVQEPEKAQSQEKMKNDTSNPEENTVPNERPIRILKMRKGDGAVRDEMQTSDPVSTEWETHEKIKCSSHWSCFNLWANCDGHWSCYDGTPCSRGGCTPMP